MIDKPRQTHSLCMFPMRYTKGLGTMLHPLTFPRNINIMPLLSKDCQNPRCVRVSGVTIFVASYGLDVLVRIEYAVIM